MYQPRLASNTSLPLRYQGVLRSRFESASGCHHHRHDSGCVGDRCSTSTVSPRVWTGLPATPTRTVRNAFPPVADQCIHCFDPRLPIVSATRAPAVAATYASNPPPGSANATSDSSHCRRSHAAFSEELSDRVGCLLDPCRVQPIRRLIAKLAAARSFPAAFFLWARLVDDRCRSPHGLLLGPVIVQMMCSWVRQTEPRPRCDSRFSSLGDGCNRCF